MVDLLEQDLWSSVRVIIGFRVKSPTLFSRFLRTIGRPPLWSVLVDPTFFPHRMMEVSVEASVLWGTFRTQTYI